ncbi:MAG: hypothetical protein ACE5OZ_25425 [Candidatus Heimdallarchaeota archaeon]
MSKAEEIQEELVRLKDMRKGIKNALRGIEKAEEALSLIEES